jgi:hypothetical protein
MNEQQAHVRADFGVRYVYRPPCVEIRPGVAGNIGLLRELYHPNTDEHIGGIF